MKKLIILLLLASICLGMLVGCEAFDDYYKVKVTGSSYFLLTPILPYYKAGTVIKIKTHVIMDAGIHIFVNGDEIPMTYYDSDYWGYEFVMPAEDITIHITTNQFYGRNEYTFNELCPWTYLFQKDLVKVAIKTTDYNKVDSFIETKYSTKQEDIDNFKAIFDQELLKGDNNEASNADFGYDYCFYFEEEFNGWLSFGDEYYHWNDFSSWQAFKFKDEGYVLPTIENPDLVTYSFKYDGRSSDVRKYGDESYRVTYFQIDSVEFVPYEGEPINIEPKFYLDSRYGKVNILTATVFELNGEYYEILSGADYWAYTYCQLGGK